MCRINLQDGPGGGGRLAGGLEDAFEVSAQILLVGNHAGWRIGQAVGDAHVLDALAQRLLQPFDERLKISLRLLLRRLFPGIGQFVEVERAFGDGTKRLAFEFAEMHRHPFVDPVGQQQHLDILLAENFEVRA